MKQSMLSTQKDEAVSKARDSLNLFYALFIFIKFIFLL